jgi:hypothetical protein
MLGNIAAFEPPSARSPLFVGFALFFLFSWLGHDRRSRSRRGNINITYRSCRHGDSQCVRHSSSPRVANGDPRREIRVPILRATRTQVRLSGGPVPGAIAAFHPRQRPLS